MAEKIHFVCAEILDTDEWQRADGDGHVVESHSVSVFVSVAAALEAVEQGLVHDIKTEVGIRRLLAISDALAGAAPLAADAEREQA